MKYIRTKEHIYKRLFIDKAIINECGVGACDKDLNPIDEKIIKESDELEELCDDFALVIEDKIKFIGKDLKQARFWASKETRKVFGVIYYFDENGILHTKTVAKMDIKGEMKLLWIEEKKKQLI